MKAKENIFDVSSLAIKALEERACEYAGTDTPSYSYLSGLLSGMIRCLPETKENIEFLKMYTR